MGNEWQKVSARAGVEGSHSHQHTQGAGVPFFGSPVKGTSTQYLLTSGKLFPGNGSTPGTPFLRGAGASPNRVCFNCALPSDCATRRGCSVVLRLRPANSFVRATRRTVWCCSESCAYQAAYLQLETRSTRDSITRFLGEKPISYRQLPLGLAKSQSDRPETIAETRMFIDAKNGENGFVGLPHGDLVSGREDGLGTRRGGRPRKWNSEAQRKRAYRQQRQNTS